MNQLFSIALALVLPLAAWAHGGEDHGEAPVPSTITSAAPRFAATTDQFELVGVLDGAVVRVYLDQFASNTPVAKARIELESGAWKATAVEGEPAVYSVAAGSLAQPGKHPLTITVQAGELSDLMDATLEVETPGAANLAAAPAHSWSAWALGLAAAFALAAGAGVFVHRRKLARQRSLL